MSAATATYDYFLLKHNASVIRLVSSTKPLTFDTLHEEHGFGKSAGADGIGICSLMTTTGIYIIWCEDAGPANPAAIKLFKKFSRGKYTEKIQHAVATGHVAISFHKFSYDGDDLNGHSKQKTRQVPVPFKTLKELLAHMNQTRPTPTSKEQINTDYRGMCVWDDGIDHSLQENYLKMLTDQTWEKLNRHQTHSLRDASAALVESSLRAAVAAWEAYDRAAEAAPAKPQPPSTFLAKLAADSALRTGDKCPIDLEPLASYPSVLVPLCGHVCGPSAASLDKCPVCRTPTSWTEVATPEPPSI